MLMCYSNRSYLLHLNHWIAFQHITWLKVNLPLVRDMFGSLMLEFTPTLYYYWFLKFTRPSFSFSPLFISLIFLIIHPLLISANKNRDVNLHPLVGIPAEIAPFGAPKMGIFPRGDGDGGKISPVGNSGRGSGKAHPSPRIPRIRPYT
jgi:hypothetical protein